MCKVATLSHAKVRVYDQIYSTVAKTRIRKTGDVAQMGVYPAHRSETAAENVSIDDRLPAD